MNKASIIIASVLKPVNDTRMYEKLGLSLSQTNKYEVNIIGFRSKKVSNAPNILFHSNGAFKRISFGRILAWFTFLRKCYSIKPQLIICGTHELLVPCMIYKITSGAKVIYDVRENYYRNILKTNAFPLLLRFPIALYIRSKEYLSRVFIDHYFLAEKGYDNELSFSKGRNTVLENKYKRIKPSTSRTKSVKENVQLLFSGTIAETTGIFNVIDLIDKLYKKDSRFSLRIVGYCAKKDTLNKLITAIKGKPYITLEGGDKLIDHSRILKAITESDFGLVAYPKNDSTINTIPTKLYEYLAHELPMILQNHANWKAIVNKYQAAITLEFEEPDAEHLLSQITSRQFYLVKPGEEVLWSSEERKFLKAVESLISSN